MKKNITSLLLIAFFIFVVGGWSLLLAGEGGAGEKAVGPEDLIRLHIIANSDSVADQAIKYQVRDAVTAYLAPRLAAAATPADARRIVAENRGQLLAVAGETVAAAGAGYGAAMETGYFDFPLRAYGNLVLPPGRYEAVRILLGDAAGQNWWCVLFPPLCFIDGSTVAAAPSGVSPGRSTTGQIEVHWKIHEIVKSAINNSLEKHDSKYKETIGTWERGTDAIGGEITEGK